MQSGRRLTPAVSPIQHAAKFVFGPAQKSRTDAGTATLDAFKNFRAQFLNSDETLGAEKPTPANTKRLVQSDHRSWANAKKSLPTAVEAIFPSDLVGVAYPQTGMVATGQPVSPPSPPAATEPPVDPRFPYGKKIVNTPQGPITVPLPRPSWKFISYEPDPRAWFDTTIGAPTAQVRFVRDRYEKAAGAYADWTPEEKRILDRLLRIEAARTKFVENVDKYAVEPFNRLSEGGREAVGGMLEGGAAAMIEGTGGFAEPGEAVDPESGLPLPRPEEYAPEKLEKFRLEYPRTAGALRAIGGTVGGVIADPRNWPFAFSGGLSPLAQRAIAGGFAVQMGKGAIDAADRVQQIWDDPSIPLDQKYEAITNSVLSALLAASASGHALRGSGPLPLDPGLVDQLNRMGPAATQEIYSRLQAQMPRSPDQFKAGDPVVLANGRSATVLDVFPEMGRASVRLPNGQISTVRLNEIQLELGTQSVGRAEEYSQTAHKPLPSPQQIARWRSARPKRPAVGDGASLNFQVATCGPTEILVQGGDQQVWADNISPEGFLQDAKHVTRPDLSPYVLDSNMDPKIRRMVDDQTEHEFNRYRAVIQDANTPIVGLEIITNDLRAVAYFQQLLKRLGIPGRVVVK